MGRIIMVAGIVLFCIGGIFMFLERFNIHLGRLPGDIVMRSKGGAFYFPVVTCVLLSLLATLVMWLLNRR